MKNAKDQIANGTVEAPKTLEISTRRPSMEKVGETLFAANATFEQAVAKYTEEYRKRKSVTDPKFIASRTKIYLRIAERRALAQEIAK
jgi:hypothetical protein